MQKLTCGDTGIGSDCEFEAVGETIDSVVDQVMEHAASEHADAIVALGLSHGDLRNAMASKVREDDEAVGVAEADEHAEVE